MILKKEALRIVQSYEGRQVNLNCVKDILADLSKRTDECKIQVLTMLIVATIDGSTVWKDIAKELVKMDSDSFGDDA